MAPYQVLITSEALRDPRPARKNRELILNFLDYLFRNPFTEGDFQEQDTSGRTVQIKILGDYALTFWADHPVKEVKVPRIEKADRL